MALIQFGLEIGRQRELFPIFKRLYSGLISLYFFTFTYPLNVFWAKLSYYLFEILFERSYIN